METMETMDLRMQSVGHQDVVLRGRVEQGNPSERCLGDSYHVFSALNRHLGNLHGVPWLAVKGVWSGKTGEFKVYLRVQGDPAPFVELRGETLRIGARTVSVEDVELYGLRPYRELFCPYVVISPPAEDRAEGGHWWKSDDAFKASVERHLLKMGVKATVVIGRMVAREIAGHRVGGWPVTLGDLSPEDSIKVQILGIGGRRRLGAGVFSRMRKP